MYVLTWKHVLLELTLSTAGAFVAFLILFLGWFGFEFRGGAMFLWSLLCASIGATPCAVAMFNRPRIFQS